MLKNSNKSGEESTNQVYSHSSDSELEAPHEQVRSLSKTIKQISKYQTRMDDRRRLRSAKAQILFQTSRYIGCTKLKQIINMNFIGRNMILDQWEVFEHRSSWLEQPLLRACSGGTWSNSAEVAPTRWYFLILSRSYSITSLEGTREMGSVSSSRREKKIRGTEWSPASSNIDWWHSLASQILMADTDINHYRCKAYLQL